MSLIHPIPPRIWHVTVTLDGDRQRTFDFTDDAEAVDFLATCHVRAIPTTVTFTFTTNTTSRRATEWLDRVTSPKD